MIAADGIAAVAVNVPALSVVTVPDTSTFVTLPPVGEGAWPYVSVTGSAAAKFTPVTVTGVDGRTEEGAITRAGGPLRMTANGAAALLPSRSCAVIDAPPAVALPGIMIVVANPPVFVVVT